MYLVLYKIIECTGGYFERSGLSVRDIDQSYLTTDAVQRWGAVCHY